MHNPFPMHHHYDGLSISGTIATIIFAFIGQLSLAEWASFMALGAGATTIIYNIVKMWKEVKKK